VRRALALGLVAISFPVGGRSGGSDTAEARRITGPLGAGRGQVWLLRPEGDPESIVVFGRGWYSFGGANVSYYAGHAAEWGVPVPASVFSILLTTRLHGRPAGRPPASVEFVLVAGDRHEVVGTAGADDLRSRLEESGRAVDYRLVRSTDSGTATHKALKETSDASTETFWAPIDELVVAARDTR
jgi:hypothetical protein